MCALALHNVSCQGCQFILCTQTVVHVHLLVVWCHHLPYLPCQILVLQHIFGFISAKTIPYLPSQSLVADSLLPRDAFTCQMLSHSQTQDKEDVNTKIDGPHSGSSPSLFLFLFFQFSYTLPQNPLPEQFSCMQSRY